MREANQQEQATAAEIVSQVFVRPGDHGPLQRMIESALVKARSPERILVRARELFFEESSNTRGDAWGSLEAAANELRQEIDDAEKAAEEALDLPSWNDTMPNWLDSIRIARER